MKDWYLIEFVITTVSKSFGYNWRDVVMRQKFDSGIYFKHITLKQRYIIANLLKEYIDIEFIAEIFDIKAVYVEDWIDKGMIVISKDYHTLTIYFNIKEKLEQEIKMKTIKNAA